MPVQPFQGSGIRVISQNLRMAWIIWICRRISFFNAFLLAVELEGIPQEDHSYYATSGGQIQILRARSNHFSTNPQ